MRQDRLTRDVIDKSPTKVAAATTDIQLRESVDCPDCFNTAILFYDGDKTKYICENCEAIANHLPSTFIVEDRESK